MTDFRFNQKDFKEARVECIRGCPKDFKLIKLVVFHLVAADSEAGDFQGE